MTMNRVKVLWQGFPGAPGYSNHYVGSTTTAQTAIRAFYLAIAAILPTGLTLQVPNTGDQVSEATGLITGAWSGTAQAQIVSTGAGTFSGCSGAIVNWRTAQVVNGRRPMGRTFLVPLISSAYDSQGSLSSAALSTIQSAADTLITSLAGELKVWSRPKPTIAGAAVTAIQAQVPDLACVLKSRRT